MPRKTTSQAFEERHPRAAQAVEHYEISRYGTLAAWAEKLGMTDAAKLLKQTLAEEEKTDKTLTGLAETAINEMAEAAE